LFELPPIRINFNIDTKKPQSQTKGNKVDFLPGITQTYPNDYYPPFPAHFMNLRVGRNLGKVPCCGGTRKWERSPVKEKSSLDINVHACATFIFIVFQKKPSFLTYKTKLVIASILLWLLILIPQSFPFIAFLII